MANSETHPGWPAQASSLAVWACQSWFCRTRGPFWARSMKDAESGALEHRARTFLGLWNHSAMVCPRRGLSFADFLRKQGL